MATVFCHHGLATGSDDGTSWEDAYQDIQDAIDNAGSGDEVWVKGTTITLSARIDFDNSNANAVYGGFDPALTGTSGSVVGRDLPTDITVIDGSATYQGSYVNNQAYTIDGFKFYDCDNSSGNGAGIQIYLTTGTVSVSNCIFELCNANYGGGIYISGGATLDVDDCVFDTCDGETYAGGIYFSSSPGNIDGCTFDACSGGSGSAMFCSSSGSVMAIADCDIINSDMDGYGAGALVFGASSSGSIDRCYFYNNGGGTLGGAVYDTTGGTTTYTNCLFIDNYGGYGGGMYLSGGTTRVTNCTFSGNTGSSAGDAIRNTGGSNTTCANSIFWGSTSQFANAATLSVTYCCVQGGYSGTGNVSGDPDFIGTGDDPYDIDSSSSCIDAGNAGATDYPSTDYLGRARVDDPSTSNTGTGTPAYSDIGAYEYQAGGGPTVTPRPAILLGY